MLVKSRIKINQKSLDFSPKKGGSKHFQSHLQNPPVVTMLVSSHFKSPSGSFPKVGSSIAGLWEHLPQTRELNHVNETGRIQLNFGLPHWNPWKAPSHPLPPSPIPHGPMAPMASTQQLRLQPRQVDHLLRHRGPATDDFGSGGRFFHGKHRKLPSGK